MIVIALVVVAAALHASWNAIVKSIDDRLTVMAVLGLATTVVCLPVALLATPPPGDALAFLIGSVVVHGVYNLLLVALYGDTDFNQAYPLARGISPPAVALFAVLVVGESLERLADRRSGRAQRRAAGGRAAGIRRTRDEVARVTAARRGRGGRYAWRC